MHQHAELVELAQLCAFNARTTLDPRVAQELWRMALEYQERAAQADSGKRPDIGLPPEILRPKDKP